MDPILEVVKITKSCTYRTTIKRGTGPDAYQVNECGQYIFPDYYYSKGFYIRVSGCDYYDLPELGKVEKLQQMCIDNAVNLVESNKIKVNNLNILPILLKREILREL